MHNPGRDLKIKLIAPGPVQVGLLAEKLQAVQRLVYDIGQAIEGKGSRARRMAPTVMESCTLVVTGVNLGSVEVLASLPSRVQLRTDGDLGVSALQYLDKTLTHVRGGDMKELRQLYPDIGHLARVMKAVVPLSPEEDAEYEVHVSTNGTAHTLDASSRGRLQTLIREQVEEIPEQMTRRVTGVLYLIEVESGKRQIGLDVGNRHVTCYYDDSYEAVIKDLIPGSLVEVEGRAFLDANGNVESVQRITDITMVEPLIPLQWTRVDFDTRRFELAQPIQIEQSFSDGVWTCVSELLGIAAYGASRHEALVAFRDEFAALWDDVVQEDDGQLTEDAIALKRLVKPLVLRIAPLT